MAAKPIVDGIQREHGQGLSVIRLNVTEPVGARLADDYAFQYTPTFLLFDAQGQQRLRLVGAIDPAQVRQALAAP